MHLETRYNRRRPPSPLISGLLSPPLLPFCAPLSHCLHHSLCTPCSRCTLLSFCSLCYLWDSLTPLFISSFVLLSSRRSLKRRLVGLNRAGFLTINSQVSSAFPSYPHSHTHTRILKRLCARTRELDLALAHAYTKTRTRDPPRGSRRFPPPPIPPLSWTRTAIRTSLWPCTNHHTASTFLAFASLTARRQCCSLHRHSRRVRSSPAFAFLPACSRSLSLCIPSAVLRFRFNLCSRRSRLVSYPLFFLTVSFSFSFSFSFSLSLSLSVSLLILLLAGGGHLEGTSTRRPIWSSSAPQKISAPSRTQCRCHTVTKKTLPWLSLLPSLWLSRALSCWLCLSVCLSVSLALSLSFSLLQSPLIHRSASPRL